ncbi:MAG: DUF2802 domain-containing protein [Gammaproteobacteria bacterium]
MNETLLYGIAITALVISDIVLIGLGAFFLRRRKVAQADATAAAGKAEELLQAIQALTASNAVFGEHLARIEARFDQLQDALAKPVAVHKQSDHKAFEVAAKLVNQGAGVEQLMEVCGVARGEAELIRRLYGGRDDASRSAPQEAA